MKIIISTDEFKCTFCSLFEHIVLGASTARCSVGKKLGTTTRTPSLETRRGKGGGATLD